MNELQQKENNAVRLALTNKGHLTMYSKKLVVSWLAIIALCLLAAIATAQTTRAVRHGTFLNQADNSSTIPMLSADGQRAVFTSKASNLVVGDTNNLADIFIYDMSTGETRRVSVASDGTQANDISFEPALSADGQRVAFISRASNLVAGDANDESDIFIHDLATSETTLVSVTSNGIQADGYSDYPALSADGQKVAFVSDADTLVAGDTNEEFDIFIHDTLTGKTIRVNVASDGTQANGSSFRPTLSADGQKVSFSSGASNLVDGDTNDSLDIFIHDTLTGETQRVSVASDGTQADGESYDPTLSGDGLRVAFLSNASNLADDDIDDFADIFVQVIIEPVAGEELPFNSGFE